MYGLSGKYASHIIQCKECALKWVQMTYCIEGFGESNHDDHPSYGIEDDKMKNKNGHKTKSRFNENLCSSSTIYLPSGLLSSSSSTPLSESDYPIHKTTEDGENNTWKKQKDKDNVDKVEIVLETKDKEDDTQTMMKLKSVKPICSRCKRKGHHSDQCEVDLTRYCNSCQVFGHLTEKCRDYPRLEPLQQQDETKKTLLNKK